MAISLQDFQRYFDAKRNGTYKCPFCGKETFLPNLQAPGEMALSVMVSANVNPLQPSHHHFYSFSCSTCGRTDFFHTNQVERWVSENTGEKKDG
jgi:predicted nucleic-acid-binding Zn-ribbon protein